MFKLVAVEGDNQHVLDEGRTVVGRDPSCDVRIGEGKVSKHHAEFIVERESIAIEDLGSTNGTFVNNRRVDAKRSLSLGDVVRFESIAFYVASTYDEPRTVLARNMPQGASAASKIAVEAEDAAHTVFEQEYALPAHWPSAEDDAMFSDRANKYSVEQVDQVLKVHAPNREAFATALVIMSEPHEPQLFGFQVTAAKHHWSLGRAPDQSVTLMNVSVSGKHATLIYDDGRWAIRDENSSNQVKVNNKVQQLCPLSDGDTVALGNLDLVFRVFE